MSTPTLEALQCEWERLTDMINDLRAISIAMVAVYPLDLIVIGLIGSLSMAIISFWVCRFLLMEPVESLDVLLGTLSGVSCIFGFYKLAQFMSRALEVVFIHKDLNALIRRRNAIVQAIEKQKGTAA
jgi:hypothetical protein